MSIRKFFLWALICFSPLAWATAALDDPTLSLTVMQFTAKDKTQKLELKKRMDVMRVYLKKQPGFVDNVILENRNADNKPDFVGVSRWKSLKDWEALWNSKEYQKIVSNVTEIADVSPGMFTPIK